MIPVRIIRLLLAARYPRAFVREVICELMHYQVPVDPLVHTNFSGVPFTNKQFLKRSRALLGQCRAGASNAILA